MMDAGIPHPKRVILSSGSTHFYQEMSPRMYGHNMLWKKGILQQKQ